MSRKEIRLVLLVIFLLPAIASPIGYSQPDSTPKSDISLVKAFKHVTVSYLTVFFYDSNMTCTGYTSFALTRPTVVSVTIPQKSAFLLARLDPLSNLTISGVYDETQVNYLSDQLSLLLDNEIIASPHYALINTTIFRSKTIFIHISRGEKEGFAELLFRMSELLDERRIVIGAHSSYKYTFNITKLGSWRLKALEVVVLLASHITPRLKLNCFSYDLVEFHVRNLGNIKYYEFKLLIFDRKFELLNANSFDTLAVIQVLPIFYKPAAIDWQTGVIDCSINSPNTLLRLIMPPHIIVHSQALMSFDPLFNYTVPGVYCVASNGKVRLLASPLPWTFNLRHLGEAIHDKITLKILTADGRIIKTISRIEPTTEIHVPLTPFILVEMYYEGVLFEKCTILSRSPSGEVSIPLALYDLVLDVVDSEGRALNNFTVILYSVELNKEIFNFLSKQSRVKLKHIPFSKCLLVVKISNVEAFRKIIDLEKQNYAMAICNVTTVKIKVLNCFNYPASSLKVLLTNKRATFVGITDSQGTVTFKFVPYGVYNLVIENPQIPALKFEFKDVRVNSMSKILTFTIPLRDVKVKVTDVLNHPVRGVKVKIILGGHSITATSDSSGIAYFKNIPARDLKVIVEILRGTAARLPENTKTLEIKIDILLVGGVPIPLNFIYGFIAATFLISVIYLLKRESNKVIIE